MNDGALKTSGNVKGVLRSHRSDTKRWEGLKAKANKNTKILLYDTTYQLAQRLWMNPMTVRGPL